MSVMMTMGRNWSLYDLNGVWRCENGNLSYSAFAPRPRLAGRWCGVIAR